MKALMRVIFVTIALFISLPISSKSLWRDKNIYSSAGNLRVGDILVVNIDDISKLRFNIALSNQNAFNITSIPDANISGFLPRVSSNKKINRSDNTSVSGTGNLRIFIASRIIRMLEDGKYEIAGSREYSFKGTSNRFRISGIIDPALVNGRSIKSRDIANFRLEIEGYTVGAGIKIERPELEEGKSASTALTEDEKQKIIVDYLERMLNELSR